MDRPGAAQVAWTASAEQANGVRAASDVVPAQSPWPAEERLGHDMPSIYCTRCGQANPDDARFCLHCGTMLARPGADRPGETTSIISLGGDAAAEMAGLAGIDFVVYEVETRSINSSVCSNLAATGKG